MDEEKLKKQKLLKNEIIDRCYDQAAFSEFCMQQKKIGDDLDSWTYEELEKVIKEFINKINEELSLKYNDEEIKTKEDSVKENINGDNITNENDLKINNNKDNSKINDNDNNNEQKDINKEKMIKINCKLLKKNLLNDKILNVSINKYNYIKSKNILSESYILYNIKLSSKQKNDKNNKNDNSSIEIVDFNVDRKYADFLYIREILSKYFPYNYIPSLPEKTEEYLLREENQPKIISYLQLFLNAIISKEELKAYEGIFYFLTIKDYNEYKNKLKEIISTPPPLNVEDTLSLEGIKSFQELNGDDYNNNEMEIEENQNELQFFNIKNYFEIQYKLIAQLKEHLKEFNTNFNNCFNNLGQIEQDFSFLYQLNNKVMMKETIKKSFQELGRFFQGWKDLIKKQNILVKKNISFFYNFVLHESLSYVSLIKKRENIKNLFINEYKKLDQKKEKIWKNEDIKKWEINYENFNVDNALLLKDKKYAKSKMLYKETKEFEKIKNNFEYINHTYKTELDYFLSNYLNGFKYFIQNFVKEFYPTLNDFINSWSSLSVFIN